MDENTENGRTRSQTYMSDPYENRQPPAVIRLKAGMTASISRLRIRAHMKCG